MVVTRPRVRRWGGGHVSLFSRESFVALMKKHGFSLVDTRPWPDDCAWLERLFSIERYGIQDFTKQDLQYIVDAFRRADAGEGVPVRLGVPVPESLSGAQVHWTHLATLKSRRSSRCSRSIRSKQLRLDR